MSHLTDLKQELITTAKALQLQHNQVLDAPITNIDIEPQQVKTLESLAQSLESQAPYPQPLANQEAVQYLDGSWVLLYSDAREIRSLSSLPLGLVVGQVYQIIDVAQQSFENKAYIHHVLGLVTGYVRITAAFEPKPPEPGALPDRGINVCFQKRSLNVQTILGVATPSLEPLKVFDVRPPEGRMPSLDITYLDQELRLGRGGDSSLFILTRSVA